MNIKIYDKFTKTMSDKFAISELPNFSLIWMDKFKGQKEISFCDLTWLKGTGHFDINGNEIFEGDIVKLKSYNFHYLENDEYVVKYENEDLMFKFISIKDEKKYLRHGLHSFSIIGSIYV